MEYLVSLFLLNFFYYGLTLLNYFFGSTTGYGLSVILSSIPLIVHYSRSLWKEERIFWKADLLLQLPCLLIGLSDVLVDSSSEFNWSVSLSSIPVFLLSAYLRKSDMIVAFNFDSFRFLSGYFSIMLGLVVSVVEIIMTCQSFSWKLSLAVLSLGLKDQLWRFDKWIAPERPSIPWQLIAFSISVYKSVFAKVILDIAFFDEWYMAFSGLASLILLVIIAFKASAIITQSLDISARLFISLKDKEKPGCPSYLPGAKTQVFLALAIGFLTIIYSLYEHLMRNQIEDEGLTAPLIENPSEINH